jgi:hypothetical protein
VSINKKREKATKSIVEAGFDNAFVYVAQYGGVFLYNIAL